MKIVIFHYHLNPGGVTRIIESQVEAIRSKNPKQEIWVVTGSCLNPEFYEKANTRLIVNKNLNYLTNTNNLDNNFTEIDSFLRETINPQDILHFHNLNLGKNPLVTLAVSQLASEGYHVFNHAHDFSEDRPVNHSFLRTCIEKHFKKNLQTIMYPCIDNYKYITLNSYDRERLLSYGVAESRCFLLPNPVVFESRKSEESTTDWRTHICQSLDLAPKKLIITYPVRVIRRKNIAEFILLAILLSDKANWLVTQPPKNPVELEHYNEWKKYTEASNVNIKWEAGTKVDFEKLIRTSDFCITTSIQEGFGMVFMEPWLLDTPVIGRDIPMVTKDMKDSGVILNKLYQRLIVEDKRELHEFSLEDQIQLIEKIKNNPNLQKQIIKTNGFIKDMLIKPDESLTAQNKEVILDKFSLDNYGTKLHEIYRTFTK